jgi:hypothetical protein
MCINGSYAQVVYFAKSRERPFAAIGHHLKMLRCSFRIADIRGERSIYGASGQFSGIALDLPITTHTPMEAFYNSWLGALGISPSSLSRLLQASRS